MNLNEGKLCVIMALVDGVDNIRKIDSEAFSKASLNDFTTLIRMEPLGEPYSVKVELDKSKVSLTESDDGGVTAVRFITTSCITSHSWPLQKILRVVFDSCKDFDIAPVISYLKDEYGVSKFTVQELPYQLP
jgi:S-adenosylmethionine/arginine decarboxylase-like enzyme